MVVNGEWKLCSHCNLSELVQAGIQKKLQSQFSNYIIPVERKEKMSGWLDDDWGDGMSPRGQTLSEHNAQVEAKKDKETLPPEPGELVIDGRDYQIIPFINGTRLLTPTFICGPAKAAVMFEDGSILGEFELKLGEQHVACMKGKPTSWLTVRSGKSHNTQRVMPEHKMGDRVTYIANGEPVDGIYPKVTCKVVGVADDGRWILDPIELTGPAEVQAFLGDRSEGSPFPLPAGVSIPARKKDYIFRMVAVAKESPPTTVTGPCWYVARKAAVHWESEVRFLAKGVIRKAAYNGVTYHEVDRNYSKTKTCTDEDLRKS